MPKDLHLVERFVAEQRVELFVLPTFRSAFSYARLLGRIAKPALEERAAREDMKKRGFTVVWDLDRFESQEAAMYRQDGEHLIIRRIQFVRAHR
jgi:hypothetical protein